MCCPTCSGVVVFSPAKATVLSRGRPGRMRPMASCPQPPANVLNKFCQMHPQEDGNQAEEDASARIEGTIEDVIRPEEVQALVAERAEGSESAAETHGEKQLEVGIEQSATVKKPIEDAYHQATQQVDSQCSHRECRNHTSLQPFGKEEPQHRADSASEGNKQNIP